MSEKCLGMMKSIIHRFPFMPLTYVIVQKIVDLGEETALGLLNGKALDGYFFLPPLTYVIAQKTVFC